MAHTCMRHGTHTSQSTLGETGASLSKACKFSKQLSQVSHTHTHTLSLSLSHTHTRTHIHMSQPLHPYHQRRANTRNETAQSCYTRTHTPTLTLTLSHIHTQIIKINLCILIVKGVQILETTQSLPVPRHLTNFPTDSSLVFNTVNFTAS